EELVPVGEGVAHHTLAVGDVAEGVVDVGELRRRAAGLDLLDLVVAGRIGAPLDRVADQLGPGGRCRVGGYRARVALAGGARLVGGLHEIAVGRVLRAPGVVEGGAGLRRDQRAVAEDLVLDRAAAEGGRRIPGDVHRRVGLAG